MNNEKLCEYLSDIGVLLFDNIDLFFQIHSSKTNKKYKNEPEKLKESLFLYLQKTSKNENLLHQMSKQLIESYYNSQAILKYKTIKSFINILNNKLFLNYHNFIINISRYIANKNEENKNKVKRTNSDDYIFRKSNENSPIKKIVNKKPKSKPKKKYERPKRTNKYKNNYYMNIQDTNINPHSFFVNNNDYYLNMYKNDYTSPNIENINMSNEDFNDFNNNNNSYNDNDNIISYKYYSPMVNIQSKKPVNYMSNDDNLNLQQNQLLMNNNLNNFQNYNKIIPQQEQEFINDNIDFSAPDDYDFFDNEQKHLQKVQNKIMNLKNEKITKLEEQCTFTPQINSTHKFPKIMKNSNNVNTFEKLYNDSSVNKIKKEERIKKYLEEFKFAPNIEVNDKYRIKSTFEERRLKSIKKKENLEKKEKDLKETSTKKKVDQKKLIYRLYDKEKEKMDDRRKSEKKLKDLEEKKKKVINWKRVYKSYHEKYPEGNDYKKQLEKRKKFFESINVNKDKVDKNNKIIDFNDFFKGKEKENNINNINEDKKENDNNNKDEINKNNEESNNNNIYSNKEESNNNNIYTNLGEENKKDSNSKDVQEVQEAINDAYRSASIKNLLNNNNIFKND